MALQAILGGWQFSLRMCVVSRSKELPVLFTQLFSLWHLDDTHAAVE